VGDTLNKSLPDFEKPPAQEEYLPLEAVHPLTSPVYDQLAEITTSTKEGIQSLLIKFATSVSSAVTMKLPPLRLAILEDSSYLLEWTFEDRRPGFSFEQNPKDSGWYYVYSSDSSERYESGTMDQLEMIRLIGMTLKPRTISPIHPKGRRLLRRLSRLLSLHCSRGMEKKKVVHCLVRFRLRFFRRGFLRSSCK